LTLQHRFDALEPLKGDGAAKPADTSSPFAPKPEKHGEKAQEQKATSEKTQAEQTRVQAEKEAARAKIENIVKEVTLKLSPAEQREIVKQFAAAQSPEERTQLVKAIATIVALLHTGVVYQDVNQKGQESTAKAGGAENTDGLAAVQQTIRDRMPIKNAPDQVQKAYIDHEAFIRGFSKTDVPLKLLAQVNAWREFNGEDALTKMGDPRLANIGRQLVEIKNLKSFGLEIEPNKFPALSWCQNIRDSNGNIVIGELDHKVTTIHAMLTSRRAEVQACKTDDALSALLTKAEQRNFPTSVTHSTNFAAQVAAVEQAARQVRNEAANRSPFTGSSSISVLGHSLLGAKRLLLGGKEAEPVREQQALAEIRKAIAANGPISAWLKPIIVEKQVQNNSGAITRETHIDRNLLDAKFNTLRAMISQPVQRTDVINVNFLNLMQRSVSGQRLSLAEEASRLAVLDYIHDQNPRGLAHLTNGRTNDLNGKAAVELLQAGIAKMASGKAHDLLVSPSDRRYHPPGASASALSQALAQSDALIPNIIRNITFKQDAQAALPQPSARQDAQVAVPQPSARQDAQRAIPQSPALDSARFRSQRVGNESSASGPRQTINPLLVTLGTGIMYSDLQQARIQARLQQAQLQQAPMQTQMNPIQADEAQPNSGMPLEISGFTADQNNPSVYQGQDRSQWQFTPANAGQGTNIDAVQGNVAGATAPIGNTTMRPTAEPMAEPLGAGASYALNRNATNSTVSETATSDLVAQNNINQPGGLINSRYANGGVGTGINNGQGYSGLSAFQQMYIMQSLQNASPTQVAFLAYQFNLDPGELLLMQQELRAANGQSMNNRTLGTAMGLSMLNNGFGMGGMGMGGTGIGGMGMGGMMGYGGMTGGLNNPMGMLGLALIPLELALISGTGAASSSTPISTAATFPKSTTKPLTSGATGASSVMPAGSAAHTTGSGQNTAHPSTAQPTAAQTKRIDAAQLRREAMAVHLKVIDEHLAAVKEEKAQEEKAAKERVKEEKATEAARKREKEVKSNPRIEIKPGFKPPHIGGGGRRHHAFNSEIKSYYSSSARSQLALYGDSDAQSSRSVLGGNSELLSGKSKSSSGGGGWAWYFPRLDDCGFTLGNKSGIFALGTNLFANNKKKKDKDDDDDDKNNNLRNVSKDGPNWSPDVAMS